MQTIFGVFESRRQAEAVIATLTSARFVAKCIPGLRERTEEVRSTFRRCTPLHRLLDTLRARMRALLDADIGMGPFARALRRGAFVVEVFADDEQEAKAAKRILAHAGAREIDALSNDWCKVEP